jgi:2-oxoglutarate ferredoxin oxidoreductase subunit beta
LLATLDGPSYIERVAPTNPAGFNKAKRAIKKAFQKQLEGRGFALVEILSNCPTQWKMSPIESLKWVEEHMTKTFPPGVFVDR